MWSARIDRRAWRARLAAPHTLWLGPDGLWDFGARPGWRPAGARTGAEAAALRSAGFEAWCQAHPGQACHLVLSAWWVHELVLDPALPLADDRARLAYARGLLRHYHGDAAAHWPLAAWQAAGRHGVSALHGLDLAALQALAGQAGVALRSVRPWWSLALARALWQAPPLARAASSRLLVVDGRLVSQLDLVHGALDTLRLRQLDQATPQALQALRPDEPATLCCALGHGLSTGGAALGGVTLLGPLHGPVPDALWCTPAGEPPRPAA